MLTANQIPKYLWSVVVLLLLSVLIPSYAAPQTFINTGGPQIYVVPAGVTSLEVELHGSQGADGLGAVSQGGKGAIVSATLAVTPGEVLQLMVGDRYGFNGGQSGGGGATDIRRPAFSTSASCAYTLSCGFQHRLMVAGGGGGGGTFAGSHGGDAGQTGQAGTDGGTGSTAGGGGSQNAGGAAGTNSGGGASGGASAGSLGVGGILGWKPNQAGGGGGGGYYGGGGGGGAEATGASGGGGGSSWAADQSAGVSNVSFSDAEVTGPGKIIIDVPSAIPDAAFAYTGTVQTYQVAADVSAVAIMLSGAAGAGQGDVVFGRLPVTPGAELQVVLGGRGGERVASPPNGELAGGTGGYNGGGDSSTLTSGGFGGGGASDIRVSPYTLEDRVVVAGGGGGAYGFFVQFGWYGANGGGAVDGSGGNSSRNSWEPVGEGGQLTRGGRLLINCHISCTPDPEVPDSIAGEWLNGGDGDGSRGGGGGGYYGGAANHGGAGGSSFASVTGPDASRQGVGNILGLSGAMIQHARGGNSGNGSAVITAMPIAITGTAEIQGNNFAISGSINPKHLATSPKLYFGSSQQQIEEGGGQVIQLQNEQSQTILAGNQPQAVHGSVAGAQTPGSYFYRVCAQSVAGLSCGAIETITVTDSFTLTFVDWQNNLIASQQTTVGAEVTPPEAPLRTGYSFTGWSVIDFSQLTADTTVTALYTINQYSVSFDSAGGSAVASVSGDYNSALSAPANPVRTGYTFNGWSPAFPSVMPAANLSLTALWTINQYSVSFDSAGGSAVASISGDYNSALSAPANPVRTGYTFNGWSPAFPSVMPAANLLLTAQWNRNAYNVTALVNGAGQLSPASQQILYGDSASFNLQLNNAEDVVVVQSTCGASYSAGQLTTAAIVADCQIAVTVYDPVQTEVDNAEPGPVNQPRQFRVFAGSGQQRLLTAELTRSGNSTDMAPADIEAVLTENTDGSYRFAASKTGRYTFRFVDVNSLQEVELSFDILPYLAFTSSRQQAQLNQVATVAVWLSDEPLAYPVTAKIIPFEASADVMTVTLSADDELLKTTAFKVLKNGANVQLDNTSVQNALAGTPVAHQFVVIDTPVPLVLRAQATQGGAATSTVSRRGGAVMLLATEFSGMEVGYNWQANGLGLSASGNSASFDPSAVETGTYTVTVTATDGIRNGQYQLLLRVIDDCPYASCEAVSGVPDEFNPYRLSSNRLPLCPAVSSSNRVDNCEGQGQVFAEVPNLYQLSLGLFSADQSWASGQFGLALNDDELNDAGYSQIGYTVNLDILQLSTPGESVPVMIPLPQGVVIPANAVWRKFTNMQWHDFVQDSNNQLQSAARDSLGACPVVSSDVWQPGLIQGHACVRLLLEDGGPNDDDRTANGVIRDPGVLAVLGSFTLTFDSAGGSVIAPVTQSFGTPLQITAPQRTGYTFTGWSPALPATMPASDLTLQAQWQINQYQIKFETAGGQPLNPLVLNYGAVLNAPIPVRPGYTFKGWSPALPATIPAGDLTVTALWYESSAVGTSSGGSSSGWWLAAICLFGVVRMLKTKAILVGLLLSSMAQAQDWLAELSVGTATSGSSEQVITIVNSNLQPPLSGVAQMMQNSDTAYRAVLGYQLWPHWYIEAGWTDLGELIIGYSGLPEMLPKPFLTSLQPQRGKGAEFATRYYFFAEQQLQFYLRTGVLLNRERYDFDWSSRSDRSSGHDRNWLYGIGVAYQFNNAFELSLTGHRYHTAQAKTELLLLNLAYRW